MVLKLTSDAAVRDAIGQALDKAKVKTDYNHGNGVAVTPAGEPLVAGTFNVSGGFAGDLLTSLGQSDGFVAKLMP